MSADFLMKYSALTCATVLIVLTLVDGAVAQRESVNALNIEHTRFIPPFDSDVLPNSAHRMHGPVTAVWSVSEHLPVFQSDVTTSIAPPRNGMILAQFANNDESWLSQVDESPSDWRVLSETDFFGGDLTESGYQDVLIEECAAICAVDDQCRGYTYVLDRNWCWPKHDISKPLEDRPGLVSALRIPIADNQKKDAVASEHRTTEVVCAGWNTEDFFRLAHTDDVQTCLASGMNVRIRDHNGWTPLHFAARYGSVKTVITLLEAGADVNVGSSNLVQNPCLDGHLAEVGTPLHLAVQYSAVETVAALIAAGADIEARNRQGDTPLRWAAASREMTKVRMLIDAGADPNTRNNLCCNGCGGTVLGTAVRTGSIDMVRLLIEAGVNVNGSWGNASSALAAVFNDDVAPVRVEMMQLLLAAGANPNATETNGYTLMDYDEVHGDIEIMQVLLDAGADPENPEGNHRPLPHAVMAGDVQLVRLLLAAGANLNEDLDGDSLLHEAAQNGSSEIVSALINAGANVEVVDSQGRTAMQIAQRERHPEIVRVLRAAGVDVETGSRRPGRPPKFALE